MGPNGKAKVPGKPGDYLEWAAGPTKKEAQEFLDLLVSAAFWHRWGDKGDSLTSAEMSRAVAEAKFGAVSRSDEISTLPDRANALLAFDAKLNGWYTELGPEFSNVSEMLAAARDRMTTDKSESVRRDMEFLATEFVPALSRAGVDVNTLFNDTKRWARMREAIPYVRASINKLQDRPDLLADEIKPVIDMIRNDKLTVREMRKQLRNSELTDHPQIEPELYQLEDNKFALVIVVDNEGANWLAKVLRFHVAEVIRPLSQIPKFMREVY